MVDVVWRRVTFFSTDFVRGKNGSVESQHLGKLLIEMRSNIVLKGHSNAFAWKIHFTLTVTING